MVTAALPSSAKERDVSKACQKEIGQPLNKFALYVPVSVCNPHGCPGQSYYCPWVWFVHALGKQHCSCLQGHQEVLSH